VTSPTPPITFVYGNCVFGSAPGERWALFAVAASSYAGLSTAAKRELFGRLMAGLEALEADVQVLRVATAWNVDGYADELLRAYRGPHPELHRGYVEEHRRRLHGAGEAQARVYFAVRLAEPEADVATYVSQVFDSRPREWLSALRRGLAWHEGRNLAVAQLEAVRVRADAVHARLADFLDVRPVRTLELQWLVRRAFCRGLGEPEVDGLHEPRALVFECNGEGVLAPLEADVVRWMESYVEHRRRALRVESELGTSWQALLVAGALPERAHFPSSRLELMFSPPESLPFGIDLTLNARFLPNGLAVRLTRRKIQDADQIVRAEAEGDQGVSDRGYERTQHARDLLSYLQSASRPPLFRCTLSIAVAAGDPDELERRVEFCRRSYGEVRLHRPIGDQLELFCQHLPGQATRVRGYDDTLTPEQVAALMPIATHRAGSKRGFWLGYTLSGSRQPVRFHLREGSDSDRNTAILSVGALGSGKTTLDQKLKYEGFLLGARVVDCDPKGDHRFHELEAVAPHAETITLAPDPSLRGVLDPLRVAPEHLRQDAAVSFLTELRHGRPRWSGRWIRSCAARANPHVSRPSVRCAREMP
jgi:hypothetical protein